MDFQSYFASILMLCWSQVSFSYVIFTNNTEPLNSDKQRGNYDEFSLVTASTSLFCLDHRGKRVMEGETFIPSVDDPCIQCRCSKGEGEMCLTSVCSLPQDCRSVRRLMTDHCCKHICFDRKWRLMPKNYSTAGSYPVPYNRFRDNYSDEENEVEPTGYSNLTNYTLRLGFTTMCAVLILVCLMFSIHRIRKRRLRALLARHVSNTYGGDSYDEVDGRGRQFRSPDCSDTIERFDAPPPPYKQSPSIDLPPSYEDVVHVPSCGVHAPDGNNLINVTLGAERQVHLTPDQLKSLCISRSPAPQPV